MVHYFERLEAFIERWQSKRRTLEISSQNSPTNTSNNQASSSVETTMEQDNNNKSTANIDEQTRLKTIQEDEEATTSSTISCKEMVVQQKQLTRQTAVPAPEQLISCPTLLYASIYLLLVAIVSNQLTTLCRAASNPTQMQPPANKPLQGLQTSPLAAMTSLSLGLIQQLATNTRRDRWAHVPTRSPGQIRDQPRPPTRNRGQISQAISRLGNRIGARNTIRVHNAFRDFAWRILSGLSMPTPVIYEIRRQHLYSPEDDQMNDSFHARNTSRTIRSKRFLDLLGQEWPLNTASYDTQEANVNRSDDDINDSLKDRARARMFDVVVGPSRRSLLTNAFRLSSIFPFKRQEDDKTPAKSKRRNSFLRRRRRKESDRQMITIDGKQYYVDDDGKLKELKEDEELPDK